MILNDSLQRILENINEHNDIFSKLAIHPSTNYPGRTQEAILTQLLRKKKEPNVDEASEEANAYAETVGQEGLRKIQEVWNEVYTWIGPRIAQYAREEMRDPYTKKERAMGIENVRTGLKRDIGVEDDEEEESEEEEDEEDEEEAKPGTRPAEPQADETPAVRGPELETLLWFQTRGDFDLPNNIEYHRKDRPVYRGIQGVNEPQQQPAPDASGLMAMEGVVQS